MKSSLGYHTIKLCLRLLYYEVPNLIKDFLEYSHTTKLIQIYTTDIKGNYIPYIPDDKTKPKPTNILIKYIKDIGIEWDIHNSNNEHTEFPYFLINVKINPKILSGTTDYLTAASIHEFSMAISNFNKEAKRISLLLRDFAFYKLTRIDYCINFSISELLPGCDAEQIISLIKRSAIPKPYREYLKYNKDNHRKESLPGSFYLTSKSVHINCYSKYIQLLNLSKIRVENNKEPISEEILNKAKDIIRFEVQCKYHKAYNLSHKYKSENIDYLHNYMALFAPKVCREIIIYYFNKTIGYGEWHSLTSAISIIKSKNFNAQKESRLINALRQINECRSVAVASAYYTSNDLSNFHNTLNELHLLNINPVTIPKSWGIKKIPNLLNVYFQKEALDLADIEPSPWENNYTS